MITQKFREKLLALQPNMLNFAFMLTSNHDDAYDLLQDTTLKALDNESKYAENSNFKGWVFTIMRNIFINNYRRAAKVVIKADTSDDLYLINASSMETNRTPENTYAVREVHQAINSFPDEYRIPFSLMLQGYHYDEIAKRMDLPLGTIKSRIFYARKKLRLVLKDYSDND